MRSRTRSRLAAVGATLLAVVTLTACGGSSATDDATSSHATRTITRTATTSSSTSSSSTAVTRTATPTVTRTSTRTHPQARRPSHPTAGTGGACIASDLQLRFLGGAGATGHGELGFALRNTTRTACHTYGYPGVLFLDGSGTGLPTTPTHTTSDFFGQTSERELTVAAGASVSFRLGVSHVASGGGSAGCTTAAGLQVIAPDDTATMRVSLPSGGAAECGGTVTVSPLQPGTTAFSG